MESFCSSDMYFRHDENSETLKPDDRQSMYKTLDQLMHGQIRAPPIFLLKIVIARHVKQSNSGGEHKIKAKGYVS